MSIPKLVRDFYDRIWNEGDLEAVSDLLTKDFLFRGSLGSERHGRKGFTDYVQSVRGALSNYHCEILECVTEGGSERSRRCVFPDGMSRNSEAFTRPDFLCVG